MNDMFSGNNENVGIDPTTLVTIESLDDLTPQIDIKQDRKMKGSTPNPDKKPHDLLKKIVFTIIIILLMAGVGFGVYYYLSLANSKKGGINPINKTIKLNERRVVVGTNINEYLKESFKNCQIDAQNIDGSKVGQYSYGLECNNMKYEGMLSVEEYENKNITTELTIVNQNDNVMPERFVKSFSSYTYTFIDAKILKDNLAIPNSIYPVEINVFGEGINDKITSLLYVTEKSPNYYLKCSKDIDSYIYAIDEDNNTFGACINQKDVTYDEKSFYNNLLNSKNGKLAYDGDLDYYIVYSESEFVIKYNKLISKEELDNEYAGLFPTEVDEVEQHYISKGYSCEKTIL